MYKNRQKENAYQRACQKKWRARHPEKMRAKQLKYKFGMTLEHYEEMLKAQGGVCAICGRPETKIGRGGVVKPLSVDHDHSTDAVRALLCNNCNFAIGALEDNPVLAENAARYLRAHEESQNRTKD